MYVLKRRPEDFIVEEALDFKPLAKGPYLLVAVEKREKNTEEVVAAIAKRLKLPRKALAYAGTKDRHAVTRQHVTIRGATKTALKNVGLDGVTLAPIGYVKEPLGLGAHTANAFRITVRNLEGKRKLALPTSIPNYFDEQRFSTKNAEIGNALIRKDFAEAVQLIRASDRASDATVNKHLAVNQNDYVGALVALPRQTVKLYLHAYQSLLWNRLLARYVQARDDAPKSLDYSLGALLFPTKRMRQALLPLPGFDTTPADEEVKALLDAVLAEAELAPADFVIRQLPNLSLTGDQRAALMDVRDFKAMAYRKDDAHPGKHKVELRFTLPKGCYATMLVKALFL